MTDTTVNEVPTEAVGPAPSIMEIMITKAKAMLKVDTSAISDDMFQELIYRGLADVCNSGMTKITTKDLEGGELEKAQKAAMAKAEENLKALMAGEIKPKGKRGGKTAKVPQEIKNEALRLAKALVKDQIKADGGKVSHYKASDITTWAKQVLESPTGEELLAQAKTAVEARKKTPMKVSLAGLKPDEGLVKRAEAAKAAKKATLSATQAGKPAPRQKPTVPPKATAPKAQPSATQH
jgi:hypothetical protein